MTTILNIEGWLRKPHDDSDDIKFTDNEVLELYNCFLEPLNIAAFDCTETDLLGEWHELVLHANKNLIASTISYLKPWCHIFGSSKAREDFKNILLLTFFYHVAFAFQSESTLYSCLNVKELLARSRHEIC